jgi:hypothetical protein
LALTVGMWGGYLAAYAAFAHASGYRMAAVTATMIDSPLQSLVERSRELGSAIVLFTSLTALLILVMGLAADWRGFERSVARVRRLGLPLISSSDPMLRNAFVNRADYEAMLRSHFTDADPVVVTFGLHGLGEAIVHRILPGGSDAITAVVEIESRFGIRKFATGGAARKLVEQAAWLDLHASRLPLATIVDRCGDQSRFRYDMPYHAGARDLYEVVHTAPSATCFELLETVVTGVSEHHAASATGPCSQVDLKRYVDEKIVANARQALDFARLQLPKRYRINEQAFDMAEWKPLLDRDRLLARLHTTDTAAIHGDLTFENIIICPYRAPGWYLIDPNPENLFNSPLIDWAKLMQSLHLGYETLNRGAPAQLRGDGITLLLAQSRVYADLHASYRALLARRFDADTLREIHLHEIINYLRLIPLRSATSRAGRCLSSPACRCSCGASRRRGVTELAALLFDLDGTLVDTAEANFSAYAAALAEVGRAIERTEFEAVATGQRWSQFLPKLLPKANDASLAEVAVRKQALYSALLGASRLNGHWSISPARRRLACDWGW